MLRAVIFDLDGVIIDSHPGHKQAWKTFFDSLGKEVSDDELLFVLEGRKREAILRHFLGDLTDEEVKHYGARKDALFCGSALELKMIAGFSEFLECLEGAGLPVALASSGSHKRVAYVLNQLDLQRRFRVVVTGDDVVNGKPDPSIFHIAATGLEVSPADILVCEDAVCGVEAAKRAGMKCLAIAADGRGPLLKKAGADSVVPDFTTANLVELSGLFADGP